MDKNYDEVVGELKKQESEAYIVLYAKKDGEDYLINWFWTDAFESAPQYIKDSFKDHLTKISQSL